MASGEMSDAEFLDFNEAWMAAAALPCLCDGGIFGKRTASSRGLSSG